MPLVRIRSGPSRRRPSGGRVSTRPSVSSLALLVPLALTAAACGNSGGGSDGGTTTTAAVRSNPVFVAAGTSQAGAAGRTLRVSVGSPLPVATTATGATRNLALGPNAIRP